MRRAATLVLASACSFEHGRLPSAPDDGKLPDDSRMIVDDASGDAADPPIVIAAYNINGQQHVGVDFPGTWAADPGGICNGLDWTESVAISGTVDDALFQHYQYRTGGGTITCTLGSNLPVDQYEVTLLFGEVFVGPGCPNPAAQRIFDVIIEGMKLEDNLNTLIVGGCCHADATVPGMPFKRVYTLEVTDGTVNIALDAEPNADSMISALMLRRL